jgi:quinol monooxygenase YgiN
MVIVAGVFTMDPGQREAYLAGRIELMRVSRAEKGCIEYTFAADPLDPGRVVLFEKWESQEDLDAHLAAIPAPSAGAAPQVEPATSSIVIYDVTGERPLRR